MGKSADSPESTADAAAPTQSSHSGGPPTPVRSQPLPRAAADGSAVSVVLVAGRKLTQRFTLIHELGRGGTCVVWLAQDMRLNRKVALKLLPAEVANDEMALNDLRRETVKSQTLSHPHIMRIHDFYETPGEPAFISMEYIEGPNLKKLRARQPQEFFSWYRLYPLMIQLCSALEYAHNENLIHRDLKPSNLMLDAKERLKLADFGIAASISESSTRSAANWDKGTLWYMSPQQLQGIRPRPSDDVYSFGATLYELLTSRPPFYTGVAASIMDQIKNQKPCPIKQRLMELGLKNEVPDHVCEVIMSCLAKKPRRRPKTVALLRQKLENAPPKPAPGLLLNYRNIIILVGIAVIAVLVLHSCSH